MSRIKSIWLLLFLALFTSLFSLSALAMTCMDQGHSADDCAQICSGLDPFGFI